MQMASNMASKRLGSLCFLLFICFSSLLFRFCVFIYFNSFAPGAASLGFLCSFSPLLFVEVVGEVVLAFLFGFCLGLHFCVAFSPFAAGISCADGAAAVLAAGAAVDDGLPDVAFGALPPDFLPASREDVIGGKRSVQGRVPLFGDLRVKGGEVVIAGQDFAVGTVGAAAVAFCSA